MPTVTLTAPVRHDGERLQAGDVIPGLSGKAAARLVALGVAVQGETVQVEDGKALGLDPPDGLTPEEEAEIKAMKKADLLAALAEAGVDAAGNETVASLRAKLMEAWSNPLAPEDGGE